MHVARGFVHVVSVLEMCDITYFVTVAVFVCIQHGVMMHGRS